MQFGENNVRVWENILKPIDTAKLTHSLHKPAQVLKVLREWGYPISRESLHVGDKIGSLKQDHIYAPHPQEMFLVLISVAGPSGRAV